MEKKLSFNPDLVQGLVIKLAWPSLEIFTDDVDEIQVLAAGEENAVNELRILEKEGKLTIEQPTYGLSMDFVNGKWLQVVLRLPKKWQGSMEAYTISGMLSARGIRGRDVALDTVSGDMKAMDIDAINLSMKTVSGDMKTGGLKAEKLSLRSISGDVDIQGSSFKLVKCSSVSGSTAIEFSTPFEKVDVNSVSGEVTIRVPLDKLVAVLRSISGRIRTSGIELCDDGPRVSVTCVSADLSVINTLQ